MDAHPACADAEVTLSYTLMGSTLRPLAAQLNALPTGGVLALTTDDP